jgi:hypothetical protein
MHIDRARERVHIIDRAIERVHIDTLSIAVVNVYPFYSCCQCAPFL